MEKKAERAHKEVILAPHSGFCFGVKRAIGIAQNEAAGAYTCGPLIHNKRVTEDLRAAGIGEIESLAEAPEGATVIVRSHGEPRAFYEEAVRRGLVLVDATCPFVSRIHELVEKATGEGHAVVIVGNSHHPEVTATRGWAGPYAYVAADGADMRRLLADMTGEDRSLLQEMGIFLVAQTTIKRETFDEVVSVLREEGLPLEVNNTICNATTERQEGCRETARSANAMVVIGDEQSSNSRKLYEIAKAHCENTYFIENIEDLSLKQLQNYNRIGVAAGASTPEIAIEEVILNMSEKTLEHEEMSMQDVLDQIDSENSLRLPRSGELVDGVVLEVRDKEVIVNLNVKKDGVIPITEINMEEGQTLADMFHVGDEIQAKVLKNDDGDGNIRLSRKKLEVGVHWQEINQAFEDKSVIEVEVTRTVNGGVIAAYKEVSGFIPMSQLSDRYVEDASEFVGQTLPVKVSRVDPRRGKAVFSHKMYLNEEKQKAMEEIWEKIQVGDIVEGTVMRFTDYGAFVDIGGIDGLLHISEISWGKLKHPQEVLSVGEKIRVKVLSMSAEKGKISLGLKQTIPEPWSVIDENYTVGEVVKGKVVQIKEYGCFVELEPGLDGLVHISEVSHHRVGNINEELSVGEEVETKILEIDRERRRISLSIKETMTEEEEEARKAAKAKEAGEETPAEETPDEPEAPAEEAPAEEPEEATEEEAPIDEPEEAAEEEAPIEEPEEAAEEEAPADEPEAPAEEEASAEEPEEAAEDNE